MYIGIGTLIVLIIVLDHHLLTPGLLTLARAVFAQSRHGAAAARYVDDARAQMVAALVGYTAALTACRLPVPHLLRDELRLQLRITGRT